MPPTIGEGTDNPAKQRDNTAKQRDNPAEQRHPAGQQRAQTQLGNHIRSRQDGYGITCAV